MPFINAAAAAEPGPALWAERTSPDASKSRHAGVQRVGPTFSHPRPVGMKFQACSRKSLETNGKAPWWASQRGWRSCKQDGLPMAKL
jgi:hypothetical protein